MYSQLKCFAFSLRKLGIRNLSRTLALLGLLSWLVPVASAVAFEDALLKGNWRAVEAQLISSADNPLDPVKQIIRAHALLALNRNNESVKLFLEASSQEAIQLWKRWTGVLLEKNPHNAVALYLHGDSLARSQRHVEAITMFGRGLAVSEGNAMILNARGVAFSARGNLEAALEDMFAATQQDPSFAEAHVSLGTTWNRLGEVPTEAVSSFNEGLKRAKDYVMALNGRASAHVSLGHLAEGIADLERAKEQGVWSTVPVANMVILAVLRSKLTQQIGNGQTKILPGTPIQVVTSYIDSLSPSQARRDFIKADVNKAANENLQTLGNLLSSLEPGFDKDGQPRWPALDGRSWSEYREAVIDAREKIQALEKELKNAETEEEKAEIENEIDKEKEKAKDLIDAGERAREEIEKNKENETSEDGSSNALNSSTIAAPIGGDVIPGGFISEEYKRGLYVTLPSPLNPELLFALFPNRLPPEDEDPNPPGIHIDVPGTGTVIILPGGGLIIIPPDPPEDEDEDEDDPAPGDNFPVIPRGPTTSLALSSDLSLMLNPFGKSLAESAREDRGFYAEYQNSLIAKFPNVKGLSLISQPGGVTAEGLHRSRFETGVTLPNAYGLLYPVEHRTSLLANKE